MSALHELDKVNSMNSKSEYIEIEYLSSAITKLIVSNIFKLSTLVAYSGTFNVVRCSLGSKGEFSISLIKEKMTYLNLILYLHTKVKI